MKQLIILLATAATLTAAPILIQPIPGKTGDYTESRVSCRTGTDADGYPVVYRATVAEFAAAHPDQIANLQTLIGYLLTHGEPIIRVSIERAEHVAEVPATGESPVVPAYDAVTLAVRQRRASDGAEKTWVADETTVPAEVCAAVVRLEAAITP